MDTTYAVRIPLYGLGCGDAKVVERELATIAGVVRAYVNPASETAFVDYDPNETDTGVLRDAIERAGYRAGPIEG